MITVKQILEQYNIVSDKATDEEIKLAALSDAGIFESSKIPMIKRSLNKNINEMTEAERKTLKSLLESFMNHMILNENKSMSYPSDKDMPVVIILKRKAIRVFPDNQKIGLYYSQALDRYISIPFGPNVKDLSPQLNEAAQHMMIRQQPPTTQMVSQIRSAGQKRKRADEISQKVVDAQSDPFAILGAAAGRRLAQLTTNFDDDKPRRVTSVPSVRGTRRRTPSSQPWGPVPKEKASSTEKPHVSYAQRESTKNIKASMRRESFINNVKTIREQKQIKENVKDYIPFAGAVDAARKGKWGLAAGEAALDVATTGAGAVLGSAVPVAGTAAGAAAGAVAKGLIKGGLKKLGRSITRLRVRRRAAKRDAKRRPKRDIDIDVNLPDNEKEPKDYSSNSEPFGPIVRSRGAEYPDFAGAGRASFNASAPKPTAHSADDVNQLLQATRRGIQGYGIPQGTALNESNNLIAFKQIVENNIPSHTIQIGEETITINKSIAKKIIKLHESLNRSNKQKLERMLNEDITSLTKVINFAIKQ